MRLTTQEKLYIKAKSEYYKGTPIMSDSEFDILEVKLNIQLSTVTEMIGFNDEDRNAKFVHPSPMLSLSKYQADGFDTHQDFLNATTKWMDSISGKFEVTAKFDGNAVNLIYKNGNLVAGLTRGTGSHGRDITSKIIGNYTVPQTIECKSKIVEIRCEIVFPVDKFNKINENLINQNLTPNANERNFVAGLLNSDSSNLEYLAEMVFVAISGFEHTEINKEYLSFDEMLELGFNEKHQLYRPRFNSSEFHTIYEQMVKYRSTSNFRLDGFVISTIDKDIKMGLGENKHDPNWAKAIKFPADIKETVIESIEWNIARDGEMIPIAIMTPTLLDGSVVKRANMANLGLVESNQYYPGATVILRKAGDIIPQIVSLVTPTTLPISIPKFCPSCSSILSREGIHLMCRSTRCESQILRKLKHAIGVLDIFGLGGAQIKNIYDAGFRNAFDLLNPNLFNKEKLIASGEFKSGRALDKIFIEIEKIKTVSLVNIFIMLGVENLGKSISVQLANEFASLPADYSSLDKSVVEYGKEEFSKVSSIIEYLNMHNIGIELPMKTENDSSGIKVEFTGSPKSFGFKTKAEYLEAANKIVSVKHTKLNEAQYLIADSVDGSSSKIKAANKKGIEVITYSDFLEQISI